MCDCESDEACLEYCTRELGETVETKGATLEEIRRWLLLNPRLLSRTDDFFLTRFLRCSKYDVEKAKKKLKCYLDLRSSAPVWFAKRDPLLPEMQRLLSIGVFLPLMKTDPSGRLVVVIRIAGHDPRKSLQDDVFKIGHMTLDLVLSTHKAASIHGVAAVFDLAGVSLAHARQLTTSMIRRAVHSWQDCYPVRVKSLDFVNSPPYVNIVLNVFRTFMKQKLRERIHVHGYDMESLHRCIAKEVLPKEYGGTDGTIQSLQEFWLQEVTRNQKWFIEDEHYKTLPEKEE